jgi:hypothetical protein
MLHVHSVHVVNTYMKNRKIVLVTRQRFLEISIMILQMVHLVNESQLHVVVFCKTYFSFSVQLNKKVKYAYQEWPRPVDTASPHSQKVESRKEHG